MCSSDLERDFLVARAVQEEVLHLLRQILPRRLAIKAVMLREGFERLSVIGRFRPRPRRQRPARHAQRHIGHDQAFVEEQLDPQTVADRTGPKRGVERKQPRLDLGDGALTLTSIFRHGEHRV